jgi:hypothetical protein
MNKKGILWFIFILAIVLGSNSYAADYTPAGYSINQISNQPIFNQSPLVNRQGDVVWGGSSVAGSSLFLYDRQTATVHQLGYGNLAYGTYQINWRGDIVWAEYGSSVGIYLYNARNNSITQLSADSYVPVDGAPQLSDNGDVVWIGPLGADIQVLRYDAATGATAVLIYPGASRQGYPKINGRGDIAWLATVNNHTQILLYTAADQSIADISRPNRDDYASQQINDRGDVLWNGTDGHDTEVYLYQAKTKHAVQLTHNNNDDDYLQLGAAGDAVWVENRSGTYVITLFRAETDGISEIATSTRSVLPQINARADLVWRDIVGSNFLTNLYDGTTRIITALTTTQGAGVYDLGLADNGDVVWSLYDGSDYEVYTYQALRKVTQALTNNNGDDGITSINVVGDVAWMHFNPTDTQIMLALKRVRPQM